uniref:hypothetical protein n=1 Tax=Arhodomonas sp. AD133 TaxID=3415009 RepID=UPI003EBB235B
MEGELAEDPTSFTPAGYDVAQSISAKEVAPEIGEHCAATAAIGSFMYTNLLRSIVMRQPVCAPMGQGARRAV